MTKVKSYTGFLSAQRLKLSGDEKRRMVSVLKDMESGLIIDRYDEPPALDTGRRFDMGLVAVPVGDCGAVCCIAGWMAMVDRVGPLHRGFGMTMYNNLAERSSDLSMLVHAASKKVDQDGDFKHYQAVARVKHGARAVRNFLTHGTPMWRKAMGRDA